MKLNCDVNKLTSQARQNTSNKVQQHPYRFTLFLDEKWITSHHSMAIRKANHRNLVQKYIISCTSWDTKEIFVMVDWPA
jgi:hypothetical protein